MENFLPAHIGQLIKDIETPALVLDLDVFECNLSTMAAAAKRFNVALRPHAKAHKCGEIARLQIAAGAVGVCCQKVSEATAMVASGIRDVYVTNQVVSRSKLDRLMRLTKTSRIALAVDSTFGVDAAADAAQRANVQLPLLIEVDLGDRRSGVLPGPALLALAQRIEACSHLCFEGLQGYRAEAQHAANVVMRRNMTEEAAFTLKAVADSLSHHGIGCPVITGGGTGTYKYAGEGGVYTEIQPGSYIFMDAAYLALEVDGDASFQAFEAALFVEATVTSAASDRVLCDAGAKALAVRGFPVVVAPRGLTYYQADDEHGRLFSENGTDLPNVGDRVRLLTDNCDPTINLHDWIVAVRGDQVQAVWPVNARGPGY